MIVYNKRTIMFEKCLVITTAYLKTRNNLLRNIIGKLANPESEHIQSVTQDLLVHLALQHLDEQRGRRGAKLLKVAARNAVATQITCNLKRKLAPIVRQSNHVLTCNTLILCSMTVSFPSDPLKTENVCLSSASIAAESVHCLASLLHESADSSRVKSCFEHEFAKRNWMNFELLLKCKLTDEALSDVHCVLTQIQVYSENHKSHAFDYDFGVTQHGLLQSRQQGRLELIMRNGSEERIT